MEEIVLTLRTLVSSAVLWISRENEASKTFHWCNAYIPFSIHHAFYQLQTFQGHSFSVLNTLQPCLFPRLMCCISRGQFESLNDRDFPKVAKMPPCVPRWYLQGVFCTKDRILHLPNSSFWFSPISSVMAASTTTKGPLFADFMRFKCP